jgi:hypothetical protein
LADPKNDLSLAILGAPAGSVFPVKTEVRDPAIMSRDLKELAHFFGASLMGIAALEPSLVQLPIPAGLVDGTAEGGETRPQPEELVRAYPFAVVCAVHAEYDPRQAHGVGGRLPLQEGAIINFNLSAYIRELGYRAIIGGANPLAVAVAAGLGRVDARGRFTTKKYGARVWVGDAILTELPLAPDIPRR